MSWKGLALHGECNNLAKIKEQIKITPRTRTWTLISVTVCPAHRGDDGKANSCTISF